MDVKLFVTEVCPYCVKVTDYIEEKNLDVKIVDAGEPKYKKELLSTGGKMQVPMLSVDGEAMYESSDILDWLKNNM